MIFEPDPANYRQDVSVRGMVVAVGAAGGGVAFGLTATGQRWIGADPVALTGCFVAYVLVYGANVALMRRGERLLRPGWWPQRVVGCLAASSIGCVFAAPAPFEASSAWVLHLIVGLAIGLSIRPTAWMLPVVFLPALFFRVVFVPEASALSYAVLSAACAGAYAFYSRTSHLILRERDYGRRADAADSLAREAESLSAEFRVAMSLHDGLSGSLMALRHRLGQAASVEQARSLSTPWLLRARGFVQRHAPNPDLQPTLDQLARSLGVRLRLDTQIRADSLSPRQLADLRWIATELVANAAAHAPHEELTLSIGANAERVLLETKPGTRAVKPSGRGRGLRNIELRALHNGGGVEWTQDAFRIYWTHPGSLARLVGRASIELLVVVGIFTACLLAIERRPGPLLVAFAAFGFLAVAFWDRFARASRAEQRLREAEQGRARAEETELLSLASEALDPELRRAESALAAGRLDAVPPAFERLARQLRDIMWTLEWQGDLVCLRGDIGDIAREAGVPVPSIPESAVHDARQRWRVVAAIRGQVNR